MAHWLKLFAVFLIGLWSGSALCCSPEKPKTILRDNGIVISYDDKFAHFVGEVVGFVAAPKAQNINEAVPKGLKIKILQSFSRNAEEGQEISVFAWMMGGSACQYQWYPTLDEIYPIGMKIEVITDTYQIPYWERDLRLVPLSAANPDKAVKAQLAPTGGRSYPNR